MLNQKTIKPIKNYKKEEFEKYFQNIPEYFVYKLSSLKDIDYIDNEKLIKQIKHTQGVDIVDKYINFVEIIDDKYYIILLHDSFLCHELIHVICYKRLIDAFSQGNEMRYMPFVDEYIAEYCSTRITGVSMVFEEYKSILNLNHTFVKSKLCYWLGAYVGLGCSEKVPPTFNDVAQELKQAIVMDGVNLISINVKKVKEILNKIKILGNVLVTFNKE